MYIKLFLFCEAKLGTNGLRGCCAFLQTQGATAFNSNSRLFGYLMLILAAGSKRLQPLARSLNYSILRQRVMKMKDALRAQERSNLLAKGESCPSRSHVRVLVAVKRAGGN